MNGPRDQHLEDLELAVANRYALIAASGPMLIGLEAEMDAWEADPRSHRQPMKHLCALDKIAQRAGSIRHKLKVAQLRCDRAAGTILNDLAQTKGGAV